MLDEMERFETESPDAPTRSWLPWAAVIVAALVSVAVFVVLSDLAAGETADISSQGGEEPVLAADGATLLRRADGVSVVVDMPTPAPGSYEYPTGDMIPPWSDPHPEVVAAGEGESEAFTMWVFIFNFPDRCTDDQCDFDDLGVDTAARGGAYQGDGRVIDGDRLVMEGRIRIGQPPANGAILENPEGAEVHAAVAPHGKTLTGPDGWRQLNGPLGNPTLWWAASFLP